MNKVILIGNVGNDPEIKHINESQVAKFPLATSESYKNKEGERITQTEWHNIVIWGSLSKVVEQYVKKGSQVCIEGKITTQSYEKDGQTKYFTSIVANHLKLLGNSSNGNDNKNNNQENPSFNNNDDATDDLPF